MSRSETDGGGARDVPAHPLIQFRYTRPGKEESVYRQRLVVDRADVNCLLQERYEGRPLVVGGETILEPLAAVLWFVFPETWYDIARFHRADGTFTGWYTNFCTPVQRAGDVWSSTDLFLDLWIDPSGAYCWLDEDEFDDAVARDLLDPAHVERVLSEREVIQRRLDAREWPPRVVREIDGVAGT